MLIAGSARPTVAALFLSDVVMQVALLGFEFRAIVCEAAIGGGEFARVVLRFLVGLDDTEHIAVVERSVLSGAVSLEFGTLAGNTRRVAFDDFALLADFADVAMDIVTQGVRHGRLQRKKAKTQTDGKTRNLPTHVPSPDASISNAERTLVSALDGPSAAGG
jgi:hypothetical protein